MTRASWSVAAALALSLFLPAALYAQTASTNGSAITIRGFGDGGLTIFSATKSFKAVLGEASGPVFGGGMELGLGQHYFLSVSVTRFRRTGNRVFVFQGQVFPLTDPATITVTPLEVNLGYRFRRLIGIIPYGGGGVGFYRYQESSPNSTDSENASSTSTGFQVLAGAEVPFGKLLAAAAEAKFASVPNALGNDPSGVSNLYDEHNLGGFTILAKFIVGR